MSIITSIGCPFSIDNSYGECAKVTAFVGDRASQACVTVEVSDKYDSRPSYAFIDFDAEFSKEVEMSTSFTHLLCHDFVDFNRDTIESKRIGVQFLNEQHQPRSKAKEMKVHVGHPHFIFTTQKFYMEQEDKDAPPESKGGFLLCMNVIGDYNVFSPLEAVQGVTLFETANNDRSYRRFTPSFSMPGFQFASCARFLRGDIADGSLLLAKFGLPMNTRSAKPDLQVTSVLRFRQGETEIPFNGGTRTVWGKFEPVEGFAPSEFKVALSLTPEEFDEGTKRLEAMDGQEYLQALQVTSTTLERM